MGRAHAGGGHEGFQWKGMDRSIGQPADALHVIERFRRKDFGHMDIEITIKAPGPTRNPGLSRNKPGSICENKSLCHAPGRVETGVLMIFFVSTFFRAITTKNGDIISSQA